MDESARASATWFVLITTIILICVAAWKSAENQRSKEPTYAPAVIQAEPKPRTLAEKRRALVKEWHAKGSKIPSVEAQKIYRLITYESVMPESFGLGEGETYRLLNARDKLLTGDGYFTSSP